jgi:hypothetical protein
MIVKQGNMELNLHNETCIHTCICERKNINTLNYNSERGE